MFKKTLGVKRTVTQRLASKIVYVLIRRLGGLGVYNITHYKYFSVPQTRPF